MKILDAKLLKAICKKLLEMRKRNPPNWRYLDKAYEQKRKATKLEISQFLLGASMQFQQKVGVGWEKCEELLKELKSSKHWKPNDVWGTIERMPKKEWDQLWDKGRYHRFHKVRDWIRNNAQVINEKYGGDVWNIFRVNHVKDPQKKHDIIICRLKELDGIGTEIAAMIVGALSDYKQVNFKGCDVKVDVHVCRVISRSVYGQDFSPNNIGEVCIRQITRKMHPQDPWKLDNPLFKIGQRYCSKTNPKCSKCALRPDCKFSAKHYPKTRKGSKKT